MTSTKTEPIGDNWTTFVPTQIEDSRPHATAADANRQLARIQVADIEPSMVPFLAAAAAEMALASGTPWRISADDPAVALLRLIAKVGINHPHAGGPQTDRLLARLTAHP